MGKIGVECYRRSCKQYFISGVEECESCIDYSNYEQEIRQCSDSDLNAVLGEVRADVKELLQMIAEIPCTCDKIYTDRKLRAPDCPRCNWVEDDIVKKASRHFA